MKNFGIELVPADLSLAEPLAAFYQANRDDLIRFEPRRDETFFTPEYQLDILKKEIQDREERRGYRFYLRQIDRPEQIIGMIGLNHVVWGAFRSAMLGYKISKDFRNKGVMTAAVDAVVRIAFDELQLHRIEANVMPRNTASLRVLEKNGFQNEGISKYYLNINGVWEDHIHMVKINFALH